MNNVHNTSTKVSFITLFFSDLVKASAGLFRFQP